MNIFDQYKHLSKEDQRKIKRILTKAYIEVADIEATSEHEKTNYANIMGGAMCSGTVRKDC